MTMKVTALAGALAAALFAGPAAAQMQIPPELSNSQIEVEYAVPSDPALREVYERLKARQPLEVLAAFLSPLRLPHKQKIRLDQCGSIFKDYEPKGPVTLCYEFVLQNEKLATSDPVTLGPIRIERANALVGAFVQLALHDVAAAVIDDLDIAVFGRADDAEDKLAAFIMVQFGKEVTNRTILGTGWYLKATNTSVDIDPSDIRSPTVQRFYNYLCIAYGADRQEYQFLVKAGLLPAGRARRCRIEYLKMQQAFRATILKYVDLDLMEKVRATDWLQVRKGSAG
jgi:hypothetical protein